MWQAQVRVFSEPVLDRPKKLECLEEISFFKAVQIKDIASLVNESVC